MVSDDIVTRLREIADSEVYRADISVSKLYEAADEIERLRSENQTLKEEKAYWRLMGRETGGY